MRPADSRRAREPARRLRPAVRVARNFCAAKEIVSDVEMIRIQDINGAYERLLKNDVRYRFVIDIASLREPI